MSVSKPEVISKYRKQVAGLISLVMLSLVINPISQSSYLDIKIICLHGGVIDYRIHIIVHCIEIETLWCTVVLVQRVSKDLRAFSLVIKKGTPDPLHFLVV